MQQTKERVVAKSIPKLPHPPARALALPTRTAVNITDVQYWQATNEERLKPMMQRQTIKDVEELTNDIPNTAEDDRSSRKPIA